MQYCVLSRYIYETRSILTNPNGDQVTIQMKRKYKNRNGVNEPISKCTILARRPKGDDFYAVVTV